MHKAIGQLDTTVDNAWGVGRFAVVEYTIAGEQVAPLGWVPAQRDKVIRLDTVRRRRDGRTARSPTSGGTTISGQMLTGADSPVRTKIAAPRRRSRG